MRDLIRWVVTRKENTKNAARNRLQMALMRDRMDLSPDIINALKIDLLAVMSQYLVVGDEFQEFGIRRLDESVFLVSNIRVKELPRANAN
ncbi:MAG: cell division topological specificity factor MinE [Chloroflexi bacterium]|nr:cell division topological specificity factor MinE [Chloroflexota bacterium]MDA1218181.1 cell division topological specificity factor MinE [Chloroflexota bacterium]PKB57528.1 MAG: cell division topological specificity factor MinE [SAR202 cluster bacterium Casp-Chloro-G3]